MSDIIISSLYVCFKTHNELEDSYLLAYLDSYDFNKAVLLLSKNEYKESIEIFETTAEILEVPSYLNIGIAYYKLGKYQKANRYYRKAYKQDPSNEWLQEYLYYSLLFSGRELEANKYATSFLC